MERMTAQGKCKVVGCRRVDGRERKGWEKINLLTIDLSPERERGGKDRAIDGEDPSLQPNEEGHK